MLMKSIIKKIHWNTNQNCNMSCPFCYLWRKDNNEVLSTEHAKKLISQAADLNVEWFVFGGGDPLMRKDLLQLILYAKKLGLKVDVQTNALLLTNEFLSEVSGHIDKIGLSIDGHDDKTHDTVRNYPGHFKVVVSALEKCHNFDIPVIIRTTICKLNLGNISGIGKTLSRFPTIKKWSIREFVPLGLGAQNKDNYIITREEFLNEARLVQIKNSPLGMGFPIISVTAEEMNSCYCLISPSGEFYTHPSDGNYQSYGVFPQGSLERILSRIKYNVTLRGKRDLKERQNQLSGHYQMNI